MSWKATAFVKPLTKHADGSPITAREKLLLFVLADYHNEYRDCAWAGLSSIARDALTSRRHVISLLDDLEAKGTLAIERRGQNTNLYRFTRMSREAISPLTSEPGSPPSALATALPSEVMSAPEPPMNLQDSKNKRLLLTQLPEWLPAQEWNGYLEMRKRLHKPLVTDKAFGMAVNKLETLRKAGHDPKAVLEQSIFNSWKGLFPISESRWTAEAQRKQADAMAGKFDPTRPVVIDEAEMARLKEKYPDLA